MATKIVLPTNDNLEVSKSSSSAPSKTINTSPIVPKNGNTVVRSGMSKSKKTAAWFADQPIANNKITGGIFVLAEVMSKKYAKSIKAQSTMIV